MTTHESEIREIVDRETKAWDTQDITSLMNIFHREMIWPWPTTLQPRDPMEQIFSAGSHDYETWRRNWEELFGSRILVHNKPVIRKIAVTPEGDGAFAVVDVDTLWRDAQGRDVHWVGRTCKVYSREGQQWKLTMHTGLLDYEQTNRATQKAA